MGLDADVAQWVFFHLLLQKEERVRFGAPPLRVQCDDLGVTHLVFRLVTAAEVPVVHHVRRDGAGRDVRRGSRSRRWPQR
ncbi:hypothetical protein ACFQ60_00020 [Streptomyces zhihengii]